MKDVYEYIGGIISKHKYLNISLENKLFDKIIIIKFKDKEKAQIQKLAFNKGYEILYYDYLSPEPIEIYTEYSSPEMIWHIVDKLILGDIGQIKEMNNQDTQIMQALKTPKQIQDLYKQQKADNIHDGNVLLLAIHFGNAIEIKEVQEMILVNALAGERVMDTYPLSKKLYPLLEKFSKEKSDLEK